MNYNNYKYQTQRCKKWQINDNEKEIIGALINDNIELRKFIYVNKLQNELHKFKRNTLYDMELLINAMTFVYHNNEIAKTIKENFNKIFKGI